MCDHCAKITSQKGYTGQVTCRCDQPEKKAETIKEKDYGGCCSKKEKKGGCCGAKCCAGTKEQPDGGCCSDVSTDRKSCCPTGKAREAAGGCCMSGCCKQYKDEKKESDPAVADCTKQKNTSISNTRGCCTENRK